MLTVDVNDQKVVLSEGQLRLAVAAFAERANELCEELWEEAQVLCEFSKVSPEAAIAKVEERARLAFLLAPVKDWSFEEWCLDLRNDLEDRFG